MELIKRKREREREVEKRGAERAYREGGHRGGQG